MSKAFTKEDTGADDVAAAPARIPARITPLGARLFKEAIAARRERLDALSKAAPERAGIEAQVARYEAILLHSPVAARTSKQSSAAFGAELRLLRRHGREQVVVLVAPEEMDIVPHGCSVSSPLGRALIGAGAGDVVEVETPGGTEEVEVRAVRFPE